MKSPFIRALSASFLLPITASLATLPIDAQTNSWTSPASGNWEDMNWSLGTLPGTNQTILFTNAGWKALAIGPSTVQNYPQSLNIQNLTISSPTNSVNTLLMNYVGLDTPLTIGNPSYPANVTISSNSAVTMISSSLAVYDGAGYSTAGRCTFIVGGTFNESEGSVVNCGSVDVGTIGPASYNLTNSTLTAGAEFVGGYPSTFNQYGGTDGCTLLQVTNGGQYNLYDGWFVTPSGDIPYGISLQGGQFNQWGGTVSATLTLVFGYYNLAGGILYCGDVKVPGAPPTPPSRGIAQTGITQSGGTNFAGSLTLGGSAYSSPYAYGPGRYNLTGGVLVASNLTVASWSAQAGAGVNWESSSFTQSGGYFTNSGNIGVVGTTVPVPRETNIMVIGSTYTLNGGILETGSIGTWLGGFNQGGGTNIVGTVSGSYSLSGGWVFAQSMSAGAIEQTGGTNQVATITINGGGSYALSGGLLLASSIQISGGVFQHTGGTCVNSEILNMYNGTWWEQTTGQQFGPLQLGGGSNSIQLPTNGACVLQFANSSGSPWGANTLLTIQNWNGSLYGGGQHKIIFGRNAAALTPQQWMEIQFANPAGLPPGNYPAKILSNGEIVPSLEPMLLLSTVASPVQLSLHGQAGQTYQIQVSTNLVNWSVWTNRSCSNGIISITDANASNCPARFYRAILVSP